MKATSRVALATTFALYQASAFALGGLDKAKDTANDIKVGLYALVGVIALIYMIYVGVMAFTEKKSWSDFGWAVVHVSAVGASLGIGTWAWSLFSSCAKKTIKRRPSTSVTTAWGVRQRYGASPTWPGCSL